MISWSEVLNEGAAILRAEARLVEDIVRGTRRVMRLASHLVPVACCPGALASEVGNHLIQLIAFERALQAEVDLGGMRFDKVGEGRILEAIEHEYQSKANIPLFSATYYDGADGRRHFSLRSPPGGANVGTIAKKMAEYFNTTKDYDFDDADIGTWNGGGHEHAAGFDSPILWNGED